MLVLTGTDLYRDIASDSAARASLRHATDLVVLQEAGLAALPPGLAARPHVIYQSAPAVQPFVHGLGPAPPRYLHDRPSARRKDPLTFMRASALVSSASLRLLHIGRALESPLGKAARDTAAAHPRYVWLGDLPHATTRQRLARSHAMAICSLMEGGANVIIEAVTSGVPVLASDISGNRGMLGDDYSRLFPGRRRRRPRRPDGAQRGRSRFLRPAAAPVRRARPRFAPAAERAALLQLADSLLPVHERA
ncbi:glycosyltransferase [Massilia sp. H-1]|nr:glycosyltransferase [Massilia sp. H-1]